MTHRHRWIVHQHPGMPAHVHIGKWTFARRPLLIGAIHGLAVVAKVRLSPGVTMDSRLGCHWQPMFLPVRRPIQARAGERIPVEFVMHDLSNLEWRVGDQRQSTLMERAAYA